MGFQKLNPKLDSAPKKCAGESTPASPETARGARPASRAPGKIGFGRQTLTI